LRRFGYGFFCDGGLRGQRGQAQHSKGSILHCRGEAEILCVSSEEAENLCEKLYAPRLSPGLKILRYQRRSAFSRFTIAVGVTRTCRRSVAMSVYGTSRHFTAPRDLVAIGCTTDIDQPLPTNPEFMSNTNGLKE
jgi:hypothetical protein